MVYGIERWNETRQRWEIWNWYPSREARDAAYAELSKVSRYRKIETWREHA